MKSKKSKKSELTDGHEVASLTPTTPEIVVHESTEEIQKETEINIEQSKPSHSHDTDQNSNMSKNTDEKIKMVEESYPEGKQATVNLHNLLICEG